MLSTYRRVLLVAAVVLLAACASPSQPPTDEGGPNPDPTAGMTGGSVSNGRQVFLSRGCAACHTIQGVQGAAGTIGPNLTNVASATGERKPNMSAEDYLRESITEPDAYIVQGFRRGAMPKLPLNARQVDDLVAFLMTRQ
jgi:mono/diheme cytochrome c family protein